MTQDEIFNMAVKCYLISTGNREGFYGDALIQFAKMVAEKALKDHAMQEVQRLGQEIEQEPVFTYEQVKAHIQVAMMSTTPPQRKPLTDEQIFACENSVPDEIVSDRDWCIYFARAIEAKLKEKNT